jgi:hypothetical protein
MIRSVVVVVVLASLACTKEQPPRPRPARPAPPTESPPPKLVLTQAKLDAWLGYARKSHALGVKYLNDGIGGPGKAAAGTLEGVRAVNQVVSRVEQDRLALEEARKAAGLTELEVEQIQELVHKIWLTGKLGGTADANAQLIAQIEAARAKASPEERKAIDESLEQLKRAQEELTDFKEEKEKFGPAAVAVVLAHREAWTKLMDEYAASITRSR